MTRHPHFTPDRRLDRTLLELRERGLSMSAIATVFELYEDVEVSANQIRRRLEILGAPKNPNKVRMARHFDKPRLAVAA